MPCENSDGVRELRGVLGCSGGEQDVMVVGGRRTVFVLVLAGAFLPPFLPNLAPS